MEIVMRKVSELTPYEKNAKKHDKVQIDNVAQSIKELGWLQPLVIDKDGVVVVGHCRLLAAKKLKQKEVPCLIADDLTDEQIKKYRVLDNKLNESPWDLNLLAEDIEGVDFSEYDIDFGLDAESGGGITTNDIVEDDFDVTPPEQPKSKLGDIFQLGNHRLMCGDSTDTDAWKRLMDGDKADMVFTDPPYGVAIGDKNATLNSVQPSGRCTTNIANDTMSEEELYDMLKAAFVNVRENCSDDAVYFVTSPQGGSLGLMMMMMMMKDAGLPVRHVLMWMKNSATFSLGRLDYDYQHEPIFYTWTKSHHNYRGGENRTTVWQYDKPRKCDIHPTMKPVELVANAILDGTQEGDIVLDAFGGSGTTMIAAEQLNRNARLMELDPHYVDVIIARWESYTGRKAVLLNG